MQKKGYDGITYARPYATVIIHFQNFEILSNRVDSLHLYNKKKYRLYYWFRSMKISEQVNTIKTIQFCI